MSRSTASPAESSARKTGTRNGEIWILGDSHIGLGPGDEKEMTSWLERLRRRAPRALYLNGDLFHYYIGDPKFQTDSVRLVFAAMRAMREEGVEVVYVEGNRDFFLEGSLAEECVSRVTPRAEFVAGSRKFLVVHGDMINDDDWPYRFWRWASKNPLTRFGVQMIPGPLARRFVDSVESRLSMRNFKHKTRLPIERMEAWGRRQASQGYDQVVFGHFHHKLEIPAGEALVTVLPAWFARGEAMAVDPDSGAWRWEIV